MRSYRVYSVGPDGEISGERSIMAPTDEDAIFDVRAMQRPLDTEIWDHDRRIAKVRGRSALPPSS
jgi:hypothetical protein